MKKITLFILITVGMFSFAQQNIPADQVIKPGLQPSNWISKFNPNTFNAQSFMMGTFHYHLNWAIAKQAYEIVVNNVPKANFALYSNGVFMDSTAKSSSVSATSNIFNMRAGIVMDPKSSFYDSTYGDVPYLTSSDAYTLDTILIAGIYQKRMPEDDTLLVEIVWGDTTSAVWQPLSITAASQFYVTPKLNSSASSGNVSHLTGAAGSKLVIKRVLTDQDTITVGNPYAGYIVVVVPAGSANIPANNIVGATYTYVPSIDYTAGDVVYQYATPTDPATQNGFAGYLIGQKDYNGTNSKAYYYDRNPGKTKNTNVDYYVAGRYGKYKAGQAFLNSCMLPSPDFAWYMDFVISNQPVGIKNIKASNLNVAQNIPNPCNDYTYINYEVKEAVSVSLNVFDITGKKVQTIDDGKKFAGNYSIQLNTSDLKAGVYFYTLTAGDAVVTKRMTVIK